MSKAAVQRMENLSRETRMASHEAASRHNSPTPARPRSNDLVGRLNAMQELAQKRKAQREGPDDQTRRNRIWAHLRQLCENYELPPQKLWNDLEQNGDIDDPNLSPAAVKAYVASIAENRPDWVDKAEV